MRKIIFGLLFMNLASLSYAECPIYIKNAPPIDAYSQCLADAKKGDASAQYNVGVMLTQGIGGAPQKPSDAVVWFKKSATKLPIAKNALGNLYGTGDGVDQNYKTAISWYRKAANEGFTQSQFNLGVYYSKGIGVTQDYNLAVYWYQKSADHNYIPGMVNLGKMYAEGKGVQQDYNKAAEWYQKAANLGDNIAAENLEGLRMKGLVK